MKAPTAHVLRKAAGIAALILCLGLVSGRGMAQDYPTGSEAVEDTLSKTLDLRQAIQIALANNTQMKRALLSVRNADQDVRSAWSNVMPDVAVSANYTRNLEVPVNFIPEVVFDPEGDPETLVPVAFGTDNNWSGGLSVTQTLFNGQAFVGISTSELFKAAQSENLRATSQGIVTQTRVTYYQALVAKEDLRLIESRIERLKENLEDTRRRYEQGFVDEYAVTQLEVQLSNLRPQRTNAEYAVENANQELLDVMGLPVQLSIDIKGDLSSFDVRSETAEAVVNRELKNIDRITPLRLQQDSAMTERAMELRGDIRMLEVQKQLRGKELDARRALYLPNITASYNLQWSAAQPGTPVFFGNEDQRSRSQTIMVGVQIPIFQGFSRDAAVQQARIQIRDTELQLYQARQTANKEILSAIQGLREALQTSESLTSALEQAERGYERALIRYQNGIGSQQEVTDAELQLREAESNYAQMVSGYLTAKAQYDQAIGQVPFVGETVEDIKEQIELQ